MVVARRRVAELRRQRPLRAHPGRWRRSPCRPRRCRSPPGAARERQPPAARHPPAEDAEAAVQAEREVPHAAGAGPERRGDRGRPMIRQIKKQAPVFVAILFLFVMRSGSAATSCRTSASTCPRGCRSLGTDFYTVKAELPTAQAVVPGPGPDREHRRRQDRRGRHGARWRTARPWSTSRSRSSTSRSTGTRRSCCARRPG